MVTRTKDIYRSYYTKSEPIVRYMVDNLSVMDGMKILEPCAGDGVFIDDLLTRFNHISIDAYELNPEALSSLNNKYQDKKNIRIINSDPLLDEQLTVIATCGGYYYRIIANPPYGGWQDEDKRKYLQKLYPNLYVKETYSLFLYRCIQLLKVGGILVFITPDTFLNLHMHDRLREFILCNTKIKEISLFPSDFFPAIDFGYANLSIIVLQKHDNRDECLKNTFRVINGYRNPKELGTSCSYHNVFTFSQQELYKNADHSLLISNDSRVKNSIEICETHIGDVSTCVTGIYTGNDKKYIHPISSTIKKAKDYSEVKTELISNDYLSQANALEGINGDKCFIPIIKGGGTKYIKPDNWFIDWSKTAVNHYKTDRKARFQNSKFYFKYGLGVPMVSSTHMTAALIENKIFDQSIVGIFPHDQKLTYYLLAFFNSPTCNKLIRTINPSANNSANYIKAIPFIFPSAEVLEKIDATVENIINSIKQNKPIDKDEENYVVKFFEEIYGF